MTRAWGEDLSGRVFSRLRVIREAERMNGLRRWECVCDCGNLVTIHHRALKSGNTASCGCFRKESTAKQMTTHGCAKRGEKSRLYRIWAGMLARCKIASASGYENYGGRGISVCDRWKKFENFLSDMGDCENNTLTIERKDNDGDYETGNCRWATRLEQGANKRNNRLVEHEGVSMTICEWSRHLGISPATLIEALDKHPIEYALRTRSKPCV